MKSFFETLFIAGTLLLAGCEKEETNYDTFCPGRKHHFAAIKILHDPDSAEALALIKTVIYNSPEYKNVYVVKFPPDGRIKTDYTVATSHGGFVLFWFHFYSPARPDSSFTISLNYDNTADSIQWYLSPYVPYFKDIP